MELGSHYGYTTTFLSQVFDRVIAVDISKYMLNINKSRNDDKLNIHYIQMDLYKDDWKLLHSYQPTICLLDAVHEYESVKCDINNILQIPSVKTIIFDDYGTWPPVKKAVDEYINSGKLRIIQYVGSTIEELLKYTFVGMDSNDGDYEGIICEIGEI